MNEETLLLILLTSIISPFICLYCLRSYYKNLEKKKYKRLRSFVNKTRDKFNSVTPEEILETYEKNIIDLEQQKKRDNYTL